MSERSVICATAMLLALSVIGCGPTVTFPAPEAGDMGGTWVGTKGTWGFYRLALSDEGDGLLAVTHRDNEPTIYRINSWDLGDSVPYKRGDFDEYRQMILDTELLEGPNPSPIIAQAGAHYIRLNVAWKYKDPPWIYLVREDPAEQRARRTREAMAKYEADLPTDID